MLIDYVISKTSTNSSLLVIKFWKSQKFSNVQGGGTSNPCIVQVSAAYLPIQGFRGPKFVKLFFHPIAVLCHSDSLQEENIGRGMCLSSSIHYTASDSPFIPQTSSSGLRTGTVLASGCSHEWHVASALGICLPVVPHAHEINDDSSIL